MAHLSGGSGKKTTQTKKSTYMDDWYLLQEEKRQRRQWELEQKKKAAAQRAAAQKQGTVSLPPWINPDEYDPVTGGIDPSRNIRPAIGDAPKNDKPTSGGTKGQKPDSTSDGTTTETTPSSRGEDRDKDIPLPPESGERNTVSDASEKKAELEALLQSGTEETICKKTEEFLKEYPKDAAWLKYNDQYAFVLMDGKVHVFALGKGYKSSYDNMGAALDYVGWEAPDVTDESTHIKAKSSAQYTRNYTRDNTGDDGQSEDPPLITNRGGREPGNETDAILSDSEALADIGALVDDIDTLSQDITSMKDSLRPSNPEYQLAIDELNAKYAALAEIGAEITGSVGENGEYKIVRYHNRRYLVGNGISDTGYIVVVEGEDNDRYHVMGNGADETFSTLDKALSFIYNPPIPSDQDEVAYALVGTDKDRLPKEQRDINAEYIYDYLSNEGWTKEAICGLLGNIEQESHLNPGVWQYLNDITAGYGLVQWTPAGSKILERMGFTENQDALANNMAANDPKQLMDIQLQYLVEQLQPGSGEWGDFGHKLPGRNLESMSAAEFTQSTLTAGKLALVFEAMFERSDDKENSEALANRTKYAENWYQFFSK